MNRQAGSLTHIRRQALGRLEWRRFLHSSTKGGAEFEEAGDELGHVGEGHHVRAVAQGGVGRGMGFHEDAVSSGDDGATREHGGEFPLAAGFVAAATGELH